jgi:hypothetical protein
MSEATGTAIVEHLLAAARLMGKSPDKLFEAALELCPGGHLEWLIEEEIADMRLKAIRRSQRT